MNATGEIQKGATVVISHHVREGQVEGYERWLGHIGPVCKSYPGHLDLQIIYPIEGLTATYTVIIRFDTSEHLHGWMTSQDRRRLIENVRPLLMEDDRFIIRSGLDFWFAFDGTKARTAARWKQFFVTWSAIFPLVLVVPLIATPALDRMGVPSNRYIRTLCITGMVVWLMTYVVIPRYTKLIQKWLYR